jgi:hypothetical protein
MGMVLGAAAGWWLPNVLIPHPHEFDFLAIMGWRVVLVPTGMLIGLAAGLLATKAPPSKRPDGQPPKDGGG